MHGMNKGRKEGRVGGHTHTACLVLNINTARTAAHQKREGESEIII